MRDVGNSVLGSDWAPYRVAATDEPIGPRDEFYGGSDDLLFVHTLVTPRTHRDGGRLDRRLTDFSLAVGAGLSVLGLWKLWEIAGQVLALTHRFLGA